MLIKFVRENYISKEPNRFIFLRSLSYMALRWISCPESDPKKIRKFAKCMTGQISLVPLSGSLFWLQMWYIIWIKDMIQHLYWWHICIANMVKSSRIASFMGSTWDRPGADSTQVGPMLATRTLLYEMYVSLTPCQRSLKLCENSFAHNLLTKWSCQQ